MCNQRVLRFWKHNAAWTLALLLSLARVVGMAEESKPATLATISETAQGATIAELPSAPGKTMAKSAGNPAGLRKEVCSAVFPGGVSLRQSSQPKNSGGTALGPGQQPRPLATVVILDDGIETEWPAAIWDVTGNPTWDDTNYKYYAGSWSAWCAKGGVNGLDPATSDYANNMNAWAIHGPFSLADATAGSWSFYYWNDSEKDYDYFKFLVSINGTNFYGYQLSGNSLGWQPDTIDFQSVPTLANVCGQAQVWVAFIFSSDESNTAKGAFVDQIHIEKTTGGAQFDLVALDVFPADSAGVELPTPYNIAVGQQIYLTFRWQCNGTGATPAFRREIWLDGTRLAFDDGPATGGLIYRTTFGPWTATAGTHNLEGRLDVNSAVAESNETNNIRNESPCFAVGTPSEPVIRISPTTLTFDVRRSPGVPPPAASGSEKTASGVPTKRAADFASAERLPDGRILVWIAPKSGADLAALQKTMRAVGGKVLSLAPEGKLLAALPPAQAAMLAAGNGVDTVEPFVAQDFGGAPDAGDVPGLGERPPTPDEEEYIRKVYVPVERIEPNPLSVQRAKLQELAGPPAQVDNSPSQYFPPIRSQGGQGSCTCWAACYYYNTYTQAQDENLTVSGGDNNLICSPAFMYPLVNGGEDAGANVAVVIARLNEVGCCNWNLKPYDQSDWTTWPTEQAWIDALKRRTSASHSFDLTTDAGIAALKQHLANGNVAATRTNVYVNWWPTFHNNEGRGIQNGVLFSHQGETYGGGHALTIVGYDDNRFYNDGATTRSGAFLIANSWGSTWGIYNSTGAGSKGFMWVSYDYAKAANNCFDAAFYNDDRDNYRSRLYAVAGLNHAKRGYVTYSGGVGPTATPAWNSYAPIDRDGGTTLSLQDTKRVAVDLTEGIPSIADYTNVLLFVKYSISSLAGTNATITSAQFFHDFDGDGNYLSVSSTDPTVTIAPGQVGYARVSFSYSNPYSNTFTIYNDGTAALTITDITSRDHDLWLSWSPDPAPGPALTIPPAGSRVVTVAVDPSRTIYPRSDDQLLVHSNDTDRTPYPNAVYVDLYKPTVGTAARAWYLYR